MSRVIAVNLDGFDFDLARRLLAAGEMPELAALADDARQFVLDHGAARRTGLAGEHVATGKTPEEMERFTITRFDPRTYDTWMETTSEPPFVASLDVPNVAFDMSYFRLEDAENTMGITHWGAHDLGCKEMARPASLADELRERFGPYRGGHFVYGFVYPSEESAREMGERLAAGVEQRAEAFEWMLAERFPDWQFAQVCVSEPHSGIEGMAHGVVDHHPHANHPSAAIAREGMHAIYRAVDALIGRLRRGFPDAKLVIYSMHGMGMNESDVPTMALLAEVMYRREFGRPLLDPSVCSRPDPHTGMPVPVEPGNWEKSIRLGVDANLGIRQYTRRFDRWRARQRRDEHNRKIEAGAPGGYAESIDWIPASLYRAFWPRMKAFALPSFTDGQIRVNLQGRERRGRVARADYAKTIDELCTFLHELTDAETGRPAVQELKVDEARDPDRVLAHQADIEIIWSREGPVSLAHPSFGSIGPLPWRRVGGHTGGHGMVLIDTREGHGSAGRGLIEADDSSLRSSFDVAPTLVSLVGKSTSGFSGRSLLG